MNWDAFYGPNVAYAQDLYDQYLRDPESVDEVTRAVFEQYGPPMAEPSTPSANGSRSAGSVSSQERTLPAPDVQKIVGAARLARSIREYGHLAANVNPLGAPGPGDPMVDPATHALTKADLEALPGTIVFPDRGLEAGSCWDAIEQLRAIYCGPVGYEFDHIDDYEERAWLHEQVEADDQPRLASDRRRALLRRLTGVEGFERYLHTAFPGQKRFSIEGNDMLVPMLDRLIQLSMGHGAREIVIGMAHRGRLNVLTHVLGKPYAAVLGQFHSAAAKPQSSAETQEMTGPGWTGDVKYHLGGHRTVGADVKAEVTLADNPSHLEFVNPVVEGFARAAQDDRHHAGPPTQDTSRALAVTVHGDAAFPGEGVVTETLNLAQLPGYSTGGSVRVIVNNNLGFTTPASEGRSTVYASDVAKGFGVPILHVNADVPEAAMRSVDLAEAYRERFHKDVIIDLIGYRRWGHNEGDEPSFTQPIMYSQIAAHPTVRALYAEELVSEGVVSEDDVQSMQDEVRAELQRARDESDSAAGAPPASPPEPAQALERIDTAVPEATLRAMHDELLAYPEGFAVHRTLQRSLDRRRTALDRDASIDWGLAESLAFASILAAGTPIRLSGQDTARGTFSHRHAVLIDAATGAQLTPLQQLREARASFAVYNSPLTEAATLGFEYGYSVHAPDALVLWEAQFGDFANAGQVVIDQFITSAQAKWQSCPAVTLLLPHGYEGQGPEHSSGRLERFLQLAAQDNIRVANCTTAAQYFHLLRLQMATLSGDRRPLFLLTPKSLLRHPRAASSLADLSEGWFHPVLDDPRTDRDPDNVERIVFASGRIAIDLLGAADNDDSTRHIAVARVELLYPFPEESVRRIIERYAQAREFVWVQEEPRNMGAWTYVEPYLQALLPGGAELRYVGRSERASTAEGSPDAHGAEQRRIVAEAFRMRVAA